MWSLSDDDGKALAPRIKNVILTRRFARHHSTQMISSSGRVLKLTKEGNLAWYKTGAATGVPEAAEGGGVEVSVLVWVGGEGKKRFKGRSNS